jgi:hypothetical protein
VSIYSPKFIDLGGDAVNGVLTTVPFFPGDPRPLVQAFVKNFTAKFNAEPDAYNGRAYDTIALLAELDAPVWHRPPGDQGWSGEDQGRAERDLRHRALRPASQQYGPHHGQRSMSASPIRRRKIALRITQP